jgi:hypothetical protein
MSRTLIAVAIAVGLLASIAAPASAQPDAARLVVITTG